MKPITMVYFNLPFFILPALPYKYLLYLPVLSYVTLLTIGPPSSTNFFYFIYPFLWIYPRGKMNGHLIHYLVKKEKTDELPY